MYIEPRAALGSDAKYTISSWNSVVSEKECLKIKFPRHILIEKKKGEAEAFCEILK